MNDLETTVRLLSRIGFCTGPSLSPDGSEVAFISDLNGLPQVWRVRASGGWPELVTALEDQVLAVAWSPGGDWLAFQVAPGGGMNTQVGIVHPDGADLRILSQGERDNNRLGRWAPDGSAFMVSSNRRRPDSFDAYLVDPTTGEFRLMAEGPGLCTLTDVSPDGRFGLLHRVHYRANSDLYLVELVSGIETLLTAHDGAANFGPSARFSQDGQRVLFISDAETDLPVLSSVQLGPNGTVGPLQMLSRREADGLESLSVAPDRTTALVSWNHAGCSELELLDIETLTTEANLELPGELLNDVAWSEDCRTLALAVSGSTLPVDIWLFDRASRSLRQVTHSPHPGVAPERLVRPELVTFSAHDGLGLSAFVYRAPGTAGPGPCVVSFHGGPEFQERPRFSSLYQALLQQGISIFAPNVRGSTGFGKRFMDLDNGKLRFDAIKDIEACARAAEEAGVGVPGRLGVMGGSYGGYMTMAALSFYPGLFAAGADLFGIVNFATFFANTEPWMAAVSKEEYGDPDTEADLLRELSPLHRIDEVVAPTIVLHGANDTNVPVVEAEQVVASLQARGVPCQYELFPDEGHGFLRMPNRIASNVAVVSWFERYL